jgi:hypothetical protein
MHSAGGKVEMGGARIGREVDNGATLLQRHRKRFRRKQMSARAAGAEENRASFILP